MTRRNDSLHAGARAAAILLAWRQICRDGGRSVLTLFALGAVVAVILTLRGFQEGFYEQLRSVATDRGVPLIVTQAGIANILGARSVIPQLTRGRVEEVEGVRLAHPMTGLPVIYDRGPRRTALFLFVVDDLGAPAKVAEGRMFEKDGEVIVDRGLSAVTGLGPGDDLVIAGYPFRISGVTEGTSALFTPFAFAAYDTLIDFAFETSLADDLATFPLLSQLLVETEPGANPTAVAARIERAVPEVDVFPARELGRNDERLGRTMMGGILVILVGLTYAIGLLVVALFMFSSAEGRRRDLGILKALGFSDGAILGVLAVETSILLTAAMPVGLGMALLIARGIEAVAPVYSVLPTVPGAVWPTVAACAVFAAVGTVLSSRFVRGVAPAEVFRA